MQLAAAVMPAACCGMDCGEMFSAKAHFPPPASWPNRQRQQAARSPRLEASATRRKPIRHPRTQAPAFLRLLLLTPIASLRLTRTKHQTCPNPACDGHRKRAPWPRGHQVFGTEGDASRSITPRRRITVGWNSTTISSQLHRGFTFGCDTLPAMNQAISPRMPNPEKSS